MEAGKLDRRISIQGYTTVDDEYGNSVPAWTDIATVWASVKQGTGREFIQAAALTPESRVVFTIRWMDDITTANRVLYEGRVHEIQDVREIGRRVGVELHTSVQH